MAQTTSGTITGTVTDQSGAVVPDAKITLTDEATKDTRESHGQRFRRVCFCRAAPVNLHDHRREGRLSGCSGRPGSCSPRMQRSGAREPPSDRRPVDRVGYDYRRRLPPINTEGADTAPSLNPVQLASIPIAGRDVMALLRVLPGVGSMAMAPWGEIPASDPAGTASNGGQFGSFTPNVGGARLFWNTVLVDGQVGSNPDFPGSVHGGHQHGRRFRSQDHLAQLHGGVRPQPRSDHQSGYEVRVERVSWQRLQLPAQ